MSLVISDLGIQDELDILAAQWFADSIRIHLFQNNLVPDRNTVLGDLVEASFTGYSSAALAAWGMAVVTGNVALVINSTPSVFTFTGGSAQNVYGYYVTNSGNSTLLWVERAAGAPFNLNTAGQTYVVIAKRTHESKFP